MTKTEAMEKIRQVLWKIQRLYGAMGQDHSVLGRDSAVALAHLMEAERIAWDALQILEPPPEAGSSESIVGMFHPIHQGPWS